MRVNDTLPPEPSMVPSLLLTTMPSPTIAERFVETGMTEAVVRHLLLEGSFLAGDCVLVTCGASSRLYSPIIPWETAKEIIRLDQECSKL